MLATAISIGVFVFHQVRILKGISVLNLLKRMLEGIGVPNLLKRFIVY